MKLRLILALSALLVAALPATAFAEPPDTDSAIFKSVPDVERPAGQERVIERSSRGVAMLPFGVGQFQNGDTGLGVAFALSEAVAGGASIGFAIVMNDYASIDPKGRDANGGSVDLAAVNRAIETTALLNRIAFGTWAALAIGGVLQAQIAFVPERTSGAPRTFVKRLAPTIVPTFAFAPGVVHIGLAGSF